MIFPITLTVTDDTGFLAIVNSEKYMSFVDSNWTLPQLFDHFINEINRNNLIIWATGFERKWSVIFLDRPSDKAAFREFSQTIQVTNGKLFLTNYEDLAMAAQFKEEKIPQKHNAELCIDLDNGNYHFTIRQLFGSENNDSMTQEGINFEVIVQSAPREREPKIDKIFWSTS